MHFYDTPYTLHGQRVHLEIEFHIGNDGIELECAKVVGVYGKHDRRGDYQTLGANLTFWASEMPNDLIQDLEELCWDHYCHEIVWETGDEI